MNQSEKAIVAAFIGGVLLGSTTTYNIMANDTTVETDQCGYCGTADHETEQCSYSLN